MNNYEKSNKILDTLVDFVKLDDFCKTPSDDPESIYAKLIYMVNHGDTRLISLVNLLRNSENFLYGELCSSRGLGVLDSIYNSSIILCLSVENPEKLQFVACNTISEGIQMLSNVYPQFDSVKMNLKVYGYFILTSERSQLSEFLIFLTKLKIKYSVDLSWYLEIELKRRIQPGNYKVKRRVQPGNYKAGYEEKYKNALEAPVNFKAIYVSLLDFDVSSCNDTFLHTYEKGSFHKLEFVFDKETEHLKTIKQI